MSNNHKACFKTEQEWLETRKHIITATEMGALLGLDPWRSANKMWKEKIETNEGTRKFTGNAYTILGQYMEPLVVDLSNYALEADFKLFDEGHKVMYINKDQGFGATPDATDGKKLLECKTTKPHNYYRWAYHPPAKYLAQLYTQLLCIGYKEGYLSILSTNLTQKSSELNLPISIFKLTIDDRITEWVHDEVERFWTTVKDNKVFKVGKNDKLVLELLLRQSTEKVF